MLISAKMHHQTLAVARRSKTMELRVAATTKADCPQVFIFPETQIELIRNMQYLRVGYFDEFVLSFFTDAYGHRAMLLMQSFQGNVRSGYSAERTFQEFRERIGERQVVHRFGRARMFEEGVEFCRKNSCNVCYNMAISTWQLNI